MVIFGDDFRPMALRPRLSPGLPLSKSRLLMVNKTKTAWRLPGCTENIKYDNQIIFGGLAIMVIFGDDFRPIALRPWLSPGLPLSNDFIRFSKRALLCLS